MQLIFSLLGTTENSEEYLFFCSREIFCFRQRKLYSLFQIQRTQTETDVSLQPKMILIGVWDQDVQRLGIIRSILLLSSHVTNWLLCTAWNLEDMAQ